MQRGETRAPRALDGGRAALVLQQCELAKAAPVREPGHLLEATDGKCLSVVGVGKLEDLLVHLRIAVRDLSVEDQQSELLVKHTVRLHVELIVGEEFEDQAPDFMAIFQASPVDVSEVLNDENEQTFRRTLLLFKFIRCRNLDAHFSFHDDVEKLTLITVVKDILVSVDLDVPQILEQILDRLLFE